MSRFLPLTLLGMALLNPGAGWAHGAFPESRDVLFEQEDDEFPIVLTTFGVMVAEAADDWKWVCEEVAGGGALTTAFEVLDGGRWIFGTGIGLWYSDDHCDWTRHTSELGSIEISDIQRNPADHQSIWVSTSDDEQSASLWVSHDGGDQYSPVDAEVFGPDSQATSFLLDENGQPYFVTGTQGEVEGFWRRTESQWGFQALDYPSADAIYALAGQPAGASSIYVILRSGLGDALGVVDSTGQIETRLAVESFGDWIVAFQRDGDEIWAGGRTVGLFHSTDGGSNWSAPDNSPEAGCLSRWGSDFYQCGNNWVDGYSVLSRDMQGDVFNPVLRFGDIRETLSCPEGSDVKEICEPLWDSVAVYGLDDPLETPTPTLEPTPTSPEAEGGGCLNQKSDGGTSGALFLFALGVWGYRGRRRS